MKRVEGHARVERLIHEAIEAFELDLTGITVLTEAASGAFVVTPLIAARAGAFVVAVTRDSRYGTANDVVEYATDWATRLGVRDSIAFHVGSSRDRAPDAQLITNLGFVRPIDEAFLSSAQSGAVVSLMCEPWEARRTDVDVLACRAAGVPVLGTDEHDPRLRTFHFVGVLALRLLLELEIEVLLGTIVVISSEPFATPIVETLRSLGADVTLVDVTADGDLASRRIVDVCRRADAIVVAEHRDRRVLIGGDTGLPVDLLDAAGTAVVHIAGAVEDPERRLRKLPAGESEPGIMTVTTDLVGPRPVIGLHTAGLRVGQLLVEGMRRLGDAAAAEAAALRESPALAVEVATA